ncbi:MAG: hypothetical protein MJD61_12590 [Proteobacteria bacterium]|nr:hypothetical protein [Pseudomonadota bacterium]
MADQRPSFHTDTSFLAKHTEVLVIGDSGSEARAAVCPKLQGRVMTSATGDEQHSFGWINRSLIASGQTQQHINPYGGEDRFWMGPEGGQFSLFFAPGTEFVLEHWYTPAPFDTESFDVVRAEGDRVAMRKRMQLVNWSQARFEVMVDREIRLVGASEAWRDLELTPPDGVRCVAFESINRITNAGERPWSRDTGLLSVWILGMFQASPRTTVALPFRAGHASELGPIVNDAYFGKVPPERLQVHPGVVLFRGDGRHRSKIGISARRACSLMGSYDASVGSLTLVQFSFPRGHHDYVNSMWEHQSRPYAGDVVNSYNDGPPAPGVRPLGSFYELESSSPAAALAPGQSLTHVHRTLHALGGEQALSPIAKHALGVDLAHIRAAFGANVLGQ